MASKQETKKLVAEQAVVSGEEFVRVYYEMIDKKRHVLSKSLYSENSSLVWNGNQIKGIDKLNDFFTSLPSSEHCIHSIDAQPLPDQAIPGSTSIVVIVSGTVDYEGSKTKTFSQNFVLTAEGEVWKVISDSFRLIS